jgi:hypothetical protein
MLDELGAGFVHSQRPIIQNYPVQSGDRSPSFVSAGHLDESKATGLTGIAILHDGDTLDRAAGREERSQLVLSCFGVKVPNENVHHGWGVLFRLDACGVPRPHEAERSDPHANRFFRTEG